MSPNEIVKKTRTAADKAKPVLVEVEGKKVFRFVKGNIGGGRPLGAKSLKEFARDYLLSLSEDKKLEYLDSLPADLIWRMAEGNPHSTEDVKHTIAPTPIMELGNIDTKVIAQPDIQPAIPNESREASKMVEASPENPINTP